MIAVGRRERAESWGCPEETSPIPVTNTSSYPAPASVRAKQNWKGSVATALLLDTDPSCIEHFCSPITEDEDA